MEPSKTMSVTRRRTVPNVEVTEDAQNVMAAAMWIVMSAMATGNAEIVEAKAVLDALSVAEADNAENVMEQARLFVGIVTEQGKRKTPWREHTEQKIILHVVLATEQDILLANTVHQQD